MGLDEFIEEDSTSRKPCPECGELSDNVRYNEYRCMNEDCDTLAWFDPQDPE